MREKFDHGTEMENDQFLSGWSRQLEINAILSRKAPNTFTILVLYKNLRFSRYFEYYLKKEESKMNRIGDFINNSSK